MTNPAVEEGALFQVRTKLKTFDQIDRGSLDLP
jgi:hypothetical protein